MVPLGKTTMDKLQGYQVIETLYESSKSRVYRGRRTLDHLPVILKILQPDNPSPEAIARFRAEYDIANLKLAGCVKVYSLEPYGHSLILIMEDFGGESLDRCRFTHPMALTDFLELAIQITASLGEIHQYNVIHKDINPANLVLNPSNGQVKIIDFGIATRLSQENTIFRNPNVMEGTLAYLSPEQTGRMNRAIDYRTDFYALGATFYRLLCDRLPFETTDPMELVHCHLAKQPTPPHAVNPSIPQAVSGLIMKLLAKNAEDRYQSATGIRADLQHCLAQLKAEGEISNFPLAQQDSSDRFQIPQTLYGREQDIATLRAAFERVAQQATPALTLISGAAGIGKSVLAQELYPSISLQHSYFIAGKFELLQRNTPYKGWIQAFQMLVRQLLTESEAQLARWRKALLTALGSNGQVILDVIPELAWIIGQQPALPDLPPAAANNRFHLVLQNFIGVFAQSQYPLVLFLDDLQWADRASLQLLQRLLNPAHPNRLLVIGTYRDQEIDESHPLTSILEELKAMGGRSTSIVLSPLAQEDVIQWVAATLKCDPTVAQSLATLIHQKTAGNPQFIREFLQSLHQANLIHFDHQERTWQWNLTQIQVTQLSENFIELIADKIQNLSGSAQQTLALAACVGNIFDSKTLAFLKETSQSEIANYCWEAVKADLIEPVGDTYKYVQSAPRSITEEWSAIYQFRHDRILQGVKQCITNIDEIQTHLHIGQLLLQETPADAVAEKIFEIVNHLNLGMESMNQLSQRDQLACLNLKAGRRAKASVAYASALSYFNSGLTALGDDRAWSRDYDLTLELQSATAEAAYLSGHFEQLERLATEVLARAKTPLDRVPIYQIKIQAAIAQNNATAAIATALQTLEELGVRIPAQPKPQDIELGMRNTQQALAGKNIQDLLQLPVMEDPTKRAAMQIISSVCTPAYFTQCNLWQMMVFQKVQLSLKYGNAPGSAFGFADYGMVLCAVEQNFDRGYEFAQLASALQPQLNAKFFVPRTLLLINIYLKHWREHLRNTLAPLVEAYQTGLETGDLEYATFAIAFHGYHSYMVGRELTQLEPEMAAYGAAIAQFKQAVPLYVNQIHHQVVLNLMGRSADPCQLIGESYHEAERLPQHKADNDLYAQFQISLNKLILFYLFGHYPQSVAQAAQVEQLLNAGATGMLVVPVFYFYNALANLGIYANVPHREQQRIHKTVAQIQSQMELWAEKAPMNYLHKYHLIEAERCRILGQTASALDHYDRAIALAQDHDYLNEEALANELAATFSLQLGKSRLAKSYLQDAHYCYERWGAIAKVQDLEARYPKLLEPSRPLHTTQEYHQSRSLITTGHTETSVFDLAAVMQAAQALSSEIVLEALLTKLMKILMENAGAEKGCLILESRGHFRIEAEGVVNPESIEVLQAIPIEDHNAQSQISIAVVNYVARTHESLVLANAAQDSRFANDPYIQQHCPKSVLCLPLLNQGKLTGIVYLENNLTTHVFNRDRLEVVQLLSTQAAISIDNARHYDELELRVQARTAELMQVNQQLAQLTAELQRSNQDLEQFAYIASHDLQEPLRAITSYTQKLAQRYQGKLDEKADRYIAFAVDGATRMQQLIQALLTYSRVGRQKCQPEPTDCNTIVNKVQRDLQMAIAEHQAQLTVEPLPTLQADPTQIALLFQNLIGNALKYHSQASSQVQIKADRTGASWRFSIQDNGIGIDPQYCDRIFTIFQRLHTSDEYPGTGLGLAICEKIVQNHGGRIWVESQLGQGSTFYFEMPDLSNTHAISES
jgi:histidine kinase